MSDYPTDSLNPQPFDYAEARDKVHQLSRARRQTEDALRKAIQDAAEKEATFRALLSKEIVVAKAEHPATVAMEIAKGSASVTKALVDRRVADGMVEVHKQRLQLHSEDRASLHRLIEWSMKVSPDGQWEAARAKDAERARSAA